MIEWLAAALGATGIVLAWLLVGARRRIRQLERGLARAGDDLERVQRTFQRFAPAHVVEVLSDERAHLAGETRDYSSVVPRRPEFSIGRYLERHGIHAETHPMADDAVHEKATALQAGLLVMGAYGRSRFSERILGGATRRALWNATLPLFVQH